MGWIEWNWAPKELRLPSPYANQDRTWSAGYLSDPGAESDPDGAPMAGLARDGKVPRFAPGGADNPTAALPLSAGILGDMFEGLIINVPIGSFQPEASNLGAELARSRRDRQLPR